MSTNNDGWILMSERKPAEADLPVWVCDNGAPPHLFMGCAPGDLWKYWKPAAADIPAPPREKTQAAKDSEAYSSRYHGTWLVGQLQGGHWTSDIWHAALAYERAEVGKMLPFAGAIVTRHGEYVESVEAIRARCGGGK